MLKYPHLFRPIKVGNVIFRNRILASATGYVEINEKSLPDNSLNYYARKAMGGAAAVAVGEGQVDHPGGGSRGGACIDLSNPDWMPFLSKLSEKISRNGAIPSMELCHAGRYSATGYGPSDGEVAKDRPCFAMSEEQILRTIDAHKNAARLAKASGFKMVTIHGGHGWLPQQFFSPYYNSRTDRWGGSAENRARLAVMICDAIHDECGRDFPVEFRISSTELADGYGIEEGIEYARQLDGHADIIHVSLGVHGIMDNDHWLEMTPSIFRQAGANVENAALIKQNVHQSLVAVVAGISEPAMMEDIISSGKADFVALARQLLCDPDTPNKARAGRTDDIRQCLRCMDCWSNLMRGFRCAINPKTGREDEALSALPPAKPQRVLVVGGGIAGMQAALTAAQNGHVVTLCEKYGRLGGGIACEEHVPFKQRIKDYITLQERLLKRAGVALRLNCTVTPEFARAQDADVIIAAVGAKPIVPTIAGIEHAVCAIDVYNNPNLAGKKAIIIGAGLVGGELAVYLHSLGCEVELIEHADTISAGGNRVHAMALSGEIRRLGIQPRFNTQVNRITPGAVTLDNGTELHCDAVIYATGQKANADAALTLSDCAPQVLYVGDCADTTNIMGAVKVAWTTARHIGRFG
ncbi:MAG: FAD-dependent oxidoreductase [Oscillospiraceae bacterium]|nr:FAD-dependent oxidoreductase [Oscillospiraceae bacterium]